MWNFKKANITSIRKAIHTVKQEFLFFNKSVNEKVSIFNNTLMNIFSKFILNKFVAIDDIDPPWMTDRIKNKIIKKKVNRKIISHTFDMSRLLLITKSCMILEMKFTDDI